MVVHLYCGFSLWRQMAPQQSAKFITPFFGQFRTSFIGTIASSIMNRFGPYFRNLLEDKMYFAMH